MKQVLSVYKEFFPNGKSDYRARYFVSEKESNANGACSKIEYHEPKGEGDAHFCDCYGFDGTIDRLFRPDSITFKEISK